jgi:membrane protease YdiL (CAAX protease family)
MTEAKSWGQQLATYLALVFAFSSLFYFMMLRAHSLGAGGGLYVTGLMWCPALAGMATLLLNGRDLREIGWKWPLRKYALESWYLPLLYTLIAYVVVWSTGLGAFPNRDFMTHLVTVLGLRLSPTASTVVYVLLAGSFGMVSGTARALGEEIGWRGFLVPQLFKRVGFTGTAFISGIVWSCWHYTILIWGDYNSGTPAWFGLTCFTVMVVAMSFIYAWMRIKSGSVWTAALLHASHNLYVQAIFTPLTRNTGKTAWYIDEFGVMLPLIAVAFAIYFWTKRGELEQPEAHKEAAPVALGEWGMGRS